MLLNPEANTQQFPFYFFLFLTISHILELTRLRVNYSDPCCELLQ